MKFNCLNSIAGKYGNSKFLFSFLINDNRSLSENQIVTLIDILFWSNASGFPYRYSSVAISTPAPTCTTGNGPTQVPAPGSSIPLRGPTTTTAGSGFNRTLLKNKPCRAAESRDYSQVSSFLHPCARA